MFVIVCMLRHLFMILRSDLFIIVVVIAVHHMRWDIVMNNAGAELNSNDSCQEETDQQI